MCPAAPGTGEEWEGRVSYPHGRKCFIYVSYLCLRGSLHLEHVSHGQGHPRTHHAVPRSARDSPARRGCRGVAGSGQGPALRRAGRDTGPALSVAPPDHTVHLLRKQSAVLFCFILQTSSTGNQTRLRVRSPRGGTARDPPQFLMQQRGAAAATLGRIESPRTTPVACVGAESAERDHGDACSVSGRSPYGPVLDAVLDGHPLPPPSHHGAGALTVPGYLGGLPSPWIFGSCPISTTRCPSTPLRRQPTMSPDVSKGHWGQSGPGTRCGRKANQGVGRRPVRVRLLKGPACSAKEPPCRRRPGAASPAGRPGRGASARWRHSGRVRYLRTLRLLFLLGLYQAVFMPTAPREVGRLWAARSLPVLEVRGQVPRGKAPPSGQPGPVARDASSAPRPRAVAAPGGLWGPHRPTASTAPHARRATPCSAP